MFRVVSQFSRSFVAPGKLQCSFLFLFVMCIVTAMIQLLKPQSCFDAAGRSDQAIIAPLKRSCHPYTVTVAVCRNTSRYTFVLPFIVSFHGNKLDFC